MAGQQWLSADAAFGTLSTGASTGAGSISVNMSQDTMPVPGASQQFSILINPNVTPAAAGTIPLDNTTTERLSVASVTGSANPYTLTFVAGQTLANNHATGEYVIQVISSQQLQSFAPMLLATTVTNTSGTSTAWTDELVSASSGAVTRTLPTPIANCQVRYQKTDSSANFVTINPHASETINGAASLALTVQYDHALLRSDGTNWYVADPPAASVAFEAAVTSRSLDQMTQPAADVFWNTKRLKNLATSIASTDAPNVGQLAGTQYPYVISGCQWSAVLGGTSLGAYMTSGTVMIAGQLLTVAAVGGNYTFNGTGGTALSALATLPINSTTNVPASGTGTLVSSGGTGTVTWTGTGTNTLTGCTYSRPGTDTVAANAALVLGRSFTASNDTYVDLQDSGLGTANIYYTAVPNLTASSALANSGTVLNTVRLACISAGATSIAAAGVGVGRLGQLINAAAAWSTTATGALSAGSLPLTSLTGVPTGGGFAQITHGANGPISWLKFTGASGGNLTGVTVLAGPSTFASTDPISAQWPVSKCDTLGNPIYHTTPYPGRIGGVSALSTYSTTITSSAFIIPTSFCVINVPPGPTVRSLRMIWNPAIFQSSAVAGTQLLGLIQLNGGTQSYTGPVVNVAGDGVTMVATAFIDAVPGVAYVNGAGQQNAAGTLTVGSGAVASQIEVSLV
jgi:hypothetical protein